MQILVSCFAIIALMAIATLAILEHTDGNLIMMCVMAIAGIAGYQIARPSIRKPSNTSKNKEKKED